MININKSEEEKELISKKDLLSLTHISYGQLYRWKRKNIIPEDWFIKKSSPTGQETFFEKDKILERIKVILSMKDGSSLDEIASMFNKGEEEAEIDMEKLLTNQIISEKTKNVFDSLYGEYNLLSKKEVITISVIEKYLLSSIITLDEIKLIIDIMDKSIDKLYNEEGKIILYRKFGIPFAIGCKSIKDLVIDNNAVKIIEIDMVKEFTNIHKELLNFN